MDEITVQDAETIREARDIFERYGNWREVRQLEQLRLKLTRICEEQINDAARRRAVSA